MRILLRTILIAACCVLGAFAAPNAGRADDALSESLDACLLCPDAGVDLHLRSSAAPSFSGRSISSIALTPFDTQNRAVTMNFQIEKSGLYNLASGNFFPERMNFFDLTARPALQRADRSKLGLSTGLIYSPSDSTRFRLSLKRTVAISGDDSQPPGSDGGAAGVDLDGLQPAVDSIAIGARHQVNDQWTLLANLAWIKSETDTGAALKPTPDIFVPVQWDETTRYVVGVIFMPADRWALRAEVSLDRPYLYSASEKDETIPDQSRLWVAAAVGYHISSDLNFDLEYTRLSVKDGAPLDNTPKDASTNGGPLSDWRTSLDVISATLTIQF